MSNIREPETEGLRRFVGNKIELRNSIILNKQHSANIMEHFPLNEVNIFPYICVRCHEYSEVFPLGAVAVKSY